MNTSSSPTVPVGLSELVTVLTLIGSVLTVVFGHDWGVTANAQHYAGIAVVLMPIGLSLARALKHIGAQHATAVVTAAQTAAPVPVAVTVDTSPSPAADDADGPDPYPGDPTVVGAF